MKTIILVKNDITEEFFTFNHEDLPMARALAEYWSMTTPHLWYVIRKVVSE